MRKIRVLVVDDSVVVRRLVSKVLDSDPALEVAGIAANGRIALAKMPVLAPDVVVLDIKMPVMDGFETLAALQKLDADLPVLMFSALTDQGAEATLDALAQGASGYVAKPDGAGKDFAPLLREELVSKVKELGKCRIGPPAEVARPAPKRRPPAAPPPPRDPASADRPSAGQPPGRVDIVAIGSSTGGPNALAALLPTLPTAFPVPIVIAQHMPPAFTASLAKRLAAQSALDVQEGADGDVLCPGAAYVAPGNYHMEVEARGAAIQIRTHQGPQENSCRPAVDVLFRSVARVYGARALGVVLTGMGQDGLRGGARIAEAGGRLLAQDEATSVVWGMPGAVAQAGLADAVLPLGRLGGEITERVMRRRAARPAV